MSESELQKQGKVLAQGPGQSAASAPSTAEELPFGFSNRSDTLMLLCCSAALTGAETGRQMPEIDAENVQIQPDCTGRAPAPGQNRPRSVVAQTGRRAAQPPRCRRWSLMSRFDKGMRR